MAILLEKAGQPAFKQQPELTELRSGDEVIWDAQERSLAFCRGSRQMFLCQFTNTPQTDIDFIRHQLQANPERGFTCAVQAIVSSGLSLVQYQDKTLSDRYVTFHVSKPKNKMDACLRPLN